MLVSIVPRQLRVVPLTSLGHTRDTGLCNFLSWTILIWEYFYQSSMSSAWVQSVTAICSIDCVDIKCFNSFVLFLFLLSLKLPQNYIWQKFCLTRVTRVRANCWAANKLGKYGLMLQFWSRLSSVLGNCVTCSFSLGWVEFNCIVEWIQQNKDWYKKNAAQ